MEKVYETYKDSGVEWIGKVPENWKSVSLKWISNITKGRKPKVDYDESGENLLPYLSMEFLRDKTSNPTYASIDEKGLVFVDDGDILILWDGSKAGEIVKAKKGALSSTMAKIDITDSDFESTYLNYLLQLGEKHIQENTIGMGIPHVSGDVLKGLKMLLPPKQEQTQIAAYLDYHTQLIDTLINKKETLIQKLQEQRQAIINEAVTKGLNKNVTLIDSGIEWLGEIPEHWEVKKAKYILNEKDGIKIGPFGSSLKLDTLSESGIKIYGQGNVIKDDFELGHRYLPIDRFLSDFTQYEILPGDILVTMMGTTGKSKVFDEKYQRGILDSHLLRLRFDEKRFNGHLFSILLQEANYISEQVNYNSVGSIMAGLNSKIIKGLNIITPPIEEQIEILGFISNISDRLDIASRNIKSSIEKLKDYRQSLISEAVTGKIDVRDWQHPNS